MDIRQFCNLFSCTSTQNDTKTPDTSTRPKISQFLSKLQKKDCLRHTGTYTHIHTKYTHIHTYTQNTHIYTHAYRYTRIPIHTDTYMDTHIYLRLQKTHIHTHTNKYKHTYIHIQTHIHTHTNKYKHTYIHIQRQIHTYLHVICINTHSNIHLKTRCHQSSTFTIEQNKSCL